MQTCQADSKDKKVDQPPQAKKAKVKTTTVDLPIENQLVWQIGKDMLNLFIENEVNSSSQAKNATCWSPEMLLFIKHG